MAPNLSERSPAGILRFQGKSRFRLSDVINRASIRGFYAPVRALLVFGTAYALAFKYASNFPEAAAAPLWFPDSVLLCALLISPRRFWGWIYLSARRFGY